MSFNTNIPVIRRGLIFAVDGKNKKSYISGSTTCNDLGSSSGGTLVNGVGFDGSAWDFDGSNQYINFGNINDFDGSTPLTLDCWVNTDGVGNLFIFSKYLWSSFNGYLTQIFGNRLRFLIGDNSSSHIYIQSDPITFNQWLNMVVTYDGSKNASGCNMYINGESINFSVIGAGDTFTTTSSNNHNFVLCSESTQVGGFFDGKMSQAKVYNVNLTPQEVKQNYNITKYEFV